MGRRVDYIADNQGFHVIRDDADNARLLKRSVEPDLIQTKMTSYMDSSSLRDDARDMYKMMSPNNMMYRNNQMGRNTYMNNDMSSQMANRNMMSQDMSNNMMNRNMMGQDMPNSMMNMNSRNMMSNNIMNNQMMGQDMMRSNMNMMNQGMDRMNSYANYELMGQERNMMSQRMEIEQIPSTRLF